MCRSETPNLFLFARPGSECAGPSDWPLDLPPRSAIACSVILLVLFYFLCFFCVCSIIFTFLMEGLLLLSFCFVCSAVLFAAARLLAWLQKKETLRQPCWPPCIYQNSHCFVFSCIYQADEERVCRLPVTPPFCFCFNCFFSSPLGQPFWCRPCLSIPT